MEFDKRDLEELRDNECQGYPPIKNSTLYKMYKNGNRSKKLYSIMEFNLRIGAFSEWDLLPPYDFNFFKDEFIKKYVLPALRDYFYFLSSVKDDNLKNQGLKDLSECFYFLIRNKDKAFVLEQYVEGSKIISGDKYRDNLNVPTPIAHHDDIKFANQFTNFISTLVDSIDINKLEAQLNDKNSKGMLNEEFGIVWDIATSWSKNEQIEKNFKETGIKETDYERDQRESEDKEREKNFKETGIKETDNEKNLREQIEKNFKETGIKETDYERDQRESEDKEREKNFKETGIKETDNEREQREYEEKIQKEEELEEEMIQKYGPVAESLVEDFKSGLIDKNKLEAQLNDMKSKGMLYEEYIFDLLDSIEED